MYFIDEDGTEKPTAEALRALDTIVMFRSEAWAMAIVDMVCFINWYGCTTNKYPKLSTLLHHVVDRKHVLISTLPRTRFNEPPLLLIHPSARFAHQL